MLSQECFAEVLLACALIVKQLPCPFPGSCKVARKLCSSLLCQRWSRILVAENALMNPLTHHRTELHALSLPRKQTQRQDLEYTDKNNIMHDRMCLCALLCLLCAVPNLLCLTPSRGHPKSIARFSNKQIGDSNLFCCRFSGPYFAGFTHPPNRFNSPYSKQ